MISLTALKHFQDLPRKSEKTQITKVKNQKYTGL